MPTQPQRTVLERFPAGGPRGSCAAQRTQGRPDARVVTDLSSDQFLVVTDTTTQ
ncbi:hypothetical protein [Streptomyces rochei]|uniref:hypothetical protein n=1 Tax=Streptomyces rochei TaxID=1928 RepID=UPI0022E9AF73|nr:hypothetical protein [Streptomyces rochei]MCC8452782.1 hypothetical protein [Streptomyces rochei]